MEDDTRILLYRHHKNIYAYIIMQMKKKKIYVSRGIFIRLLLFILYDIMYPAGDVSYGILYPGTGYGMIIYSCELCMIPYGMLFRVSES